MAVLLFSGFPLLVFPEDRKRGYMFVSLGRRGQIAYDVKHTVAGMFRRGVPHPSDRRRDIRGVRHPKGGLDEVVAAVPV